MPIEAETVQPAATWRVDQLEVRVYETRQQMGRAAAQDAAAYLRARIAALGAGGSAAVDTGRSTNGGAARSTVRDAVRAVFASAPSQNEFLAALASAPGIDWQRVTAFHLDEYVGLPADAPQAFGQFLRDRLFDRVRPGVVHFLNGNATSLEAECTRYGRLLAQAPLELACIGVGENGHIAFNDPDVADFEDPVPVKVVELDLTSRRQQVNDGCFRTLAEVPKRALTMTVPAITSAERVLCVVPSRSKAEAIRRMLREPVSTRCPASILRRHPNATLYLDREAASSL